MTIATRWNLAEHKTRPGRILSADELIDAMLACKDLHEQFDRFAVLAHMFTKETNERAYIRLRQIWIESRESWT